MLLAARSHATSSDAARARISTRQERYGGHRARARRSGASAIDAYLRVCASAERLGLGSSSASGLPASVSPSTRAQQHDDGKISPGERSAGACSRTVSNAPGVGFCPRVFASALQTLARYYFCRLSARRTRLARQHERLTVVERRDPSQGREPRSGLTFSIISFTSFSWPCASFY